MVLHGTVTISNIRANIVGNAKGQISLYEKDIYNHIVKVATEFIVTKCQAAEGDSGLWELEGKTSSELDGRPSEGPKYNDKDRLWKVTRDKVSTAVQSKFGTVRSFTAYFMSIHLTSEDADRIINKAYYGMARNSEPISMTFR